MPIRVLHLTSEVGDGGDWKFIRQLASAQSLRGYQVAVAGKYVESVSHQFSGLRVSLIEAPARVRSPKDIVHMHSVLTPYVGAQKVVLHAHTPMSALLMRPFRAERTRPLVLTNHLMPPLSFIRRFARRHIFQLCSAIIAPSRENSLQLSQQYGVNTKSIATIHCGVRFENQKEYANESATVEDKVSALLNRNGPIDRPQAVCIGFAGRLNPEKRVEWLLEYARDRRTGKPQVFLLIAGRGPMKSELRQLAEEYQISDRVAFLGKLISMAPFYRLCDVVTLPSVHETFGMAPAEAMMCGVPIVRTQTAGWTSQVVDGVTGYSSAVNDKSSFFKSLDKLVESKALRSELGKNAQELADLRFSMDSCVQQYEDLYLRLFGEGNIEVNATFSESALP